MWVLTLERGARSHQRQVRTLEYATGHYGWVLALMFAAWGVSSWALAVALRSEARTMPVKIGLVFLSLAGVGEAMAAVFDINHDALHTLAGALGMLGLPIAALLISVHLGRTDPWSVAKRTLLWTANLTWVSVALLPRRSSCSSPRSVGSPVVCRLTRRRSSHRA